MGHLFKASLVLYDNLFTISVDKLSLGLRRALKLVKREDKMFQWSLKMEALTKHGRWLSLIRHQVILKLEKIDGALAGRGAGGIKQGLNFIKRMAELVKCIRFF